LHAQILNELFAYTAFGTFCSTAFQNFKQIYCCHHRKLLCQS